MKMGIKEFRERLSEVAHGSEMVELTHHGKVIAMFQPLRRDPERIKAAAESVRRWQGEMKAKGVDLEAELAKMGLDPWGEPLDHADR